MTERLHSLVPLDGRGASGWGGKDWEWGASVWIFLDFCFFAFFPFTFICMLSGFGHVQLLVTPWTVAHLAPCPWDSPGKCTGLGGHALSRGSKSAWAKLMLVSQNSVTVQATIFALPVLEWLCQDLSVSQRRGLHLMPRCRLVRS